MEPFANNQDTTVNECFAVIDTETSWQDKVISIGVVSYCCRSVLYYHTGM